MAKRTLEETQNLIIGSVVLAGITALIGGIAWAAGGLTAVLWVVGIGGFIVVSSLAVNIPEYRRQKRIAQRIHIAELEAAAGLEVVRYEGTCGKCGGRLVAGALHCTHCGAATDRKPKICQHCAVPNPDDALFCASCGKPMTSVAVSS